MGPKNPEDARGQNERDERMRVEGRKMTPVRLRTVPGRKSLPLLLGAGNWVLILKSGKRNGKALGKKTSGAQFNHERKGNRE